VRRSTIPQCPLLNDTQSGYLLDCFVFSRFGRVNVGILVRLNRVYKNADVRRDCGLRDAAAVYRHQRPAVVVIGAPSTHAVAEPGGVVRPQRQHLPLSLASSASSARPQSPVTVQKLRQRRLTRMLLFISFAWLALTAPFTLHSFLPGPSSHSTSSSSSAAATTNFSTYMSSVTTSSPVNQSLMYAEAVNRFLSRDNPEIHQTVFISKSNRLRRTTTRSLLGDENNTRTSAPSASTSPPSVSGNISPSLYLLIKIICFLLMYVNHAINFYLYCLTGKRFRRELASMLNCSRMTFACSGGTEETPVALVEHEMAVQNIRRDIHQLAGRTPVMNQAHFRSTSSRTRPGCMFRQPEFVDERYS